MIENIKYQWSDAWLLHSIILAKKRDGATLDRIFYYGDGINKAVFTKEELGSGLYRLETGGYIEEENYKFIPTKKAVKAYKKAKGFFKSLFDVTNSLANILEAGPDIPPPNSNNNLEYPGLTTTRYEAAITEYKSWFNKKTKQGRAE